MRPRHAQGKGERLKQRSGSAMLEFGLTFPFMLVAFFFCWQVLRVFVYDTLGSYAAFAAARSYAVFHSVDLSDQKGAGSEEGSDAEWLARDVAAAALAPYAGGMLGEERGKHAPLGSIRIAFQGAEMGGFDVAEITSKLAGNLFDEGKTESQDPNDVVNDYMDAAAGGDYECIVDNAVESLFDSVEAQVRRLVESMLADALEPVLQRVSHEFGQGMHGIEQVGQGLDGTGPAFALGLLSLTTGGKRALGLYMPWPGLDAARLNVARFQDSFRVDVDALDSGPEVQLKEDYCYGPDDLPNAEEGEGVHARVAHVSFHYHLPLWLGFTRFGNGSTNLYGGTDYPVIEIYNAAACPLEPEIYVKESEAEEVEDPAESNKARLEELDAAKEDVNLRCDDLVTYLEEVRTTTATRTCRRSWPSGEQWDVAKDLAEEHPHKDSGYCKLIAENEHWALDEIGADGDRFRQEYCFPMEVELYEEVADWMAGNIEPDYRTLRIDLKRTLEDEIAYREAVIDWIGKEIEALESDDSKTSSYADAVAQYNKDLADYYDDLADYYEELDTYLDGWDGEPPKPEKPTKPSRPTKPGPSDYPTETTVGKNVRGGISDCRATGKSSAESSEKDGDTIRTHANHASIQARIDEVWEPRKVAEEAVLADDETLAGGARGPLVELGTALSVYYAKQKEIMKANTDKLTEAAGKAWGGEE